MTLAELNRLLDNDDLPGIFLVCSEERYFIDEALRRIIDHAVPVEARDFNLSLFQGRDFRPAVIIEQARTLPVFAARRLVVIKELQEASADQLEGLLPYLEDPIEETLLLMTATKVDSRRKFFQSVKKRGTLAEFKKLYENQLPAFVRETARKKGVAFTANAMMLFCKRVGTNLTEVCGELEKLVSYLGDRDLADEDDVAAVVSDTRVESVFSLMDALGNRDTAEALRLLNRLIIEGQAPLMILAMISRHFRQLWKASELVSQQVPQKDLARRIGISPYFLKGLVDQAKGYDETCYRQVFRELLRVDLALKSSAGDPVAHLEELVLLIGSLCRAKEKGVA